MCEQPENPKACHWLDFERLPNAFGDCQNPRNKCQMPGNKKKERNKERKKISSRAEDQVRPSVECVQTSYKCRSMYASISKSEIVLLLYGSEMWTLRADDMQRLSVFEHRCLRSIRRTQSENFVRELGHLNVRCSVLGLNIVGQVFN